MNTHCRTPAEVVDDLCLQIRDPESALLNGVYTSKAVNLEVIAGSASDVPSLSASFIERCACVCLRRVCVCVIAGLASDVPSLKF